MFEGRAPEEPQNKKAEAERAGWGGSVYVNEFVDSIDSWPSRAACQLTGGSYVCWA